MKIKNILCILLALGLVTAITGCSQPAKQDNSPTESVASMESVSEETVGETEAPAETADVLVEGATTTPDANSPTGFKTTFVYKDTEAQSVQLTGEFNFALNGDQTVLYGAEDWTKEMDHSAGLPLAPSDRVIDMQKNEDGVWSISLELPGGNYRYHYLVDGKKALDPMNMPMSNGSYTLKRNSVFVGYDAALQSVDMSYLMPVEGTEAGNVSFVKCPTNDLLDDAEQYLGIYLPAHYDPARETPYKTMYASQGTGGNEIGWWQFGRMNHIIDNAVKNGQVEEFIVVTMNNTLFQNEKQVWDMNKATDNLLNNIIPFIEENYNVSQNSEDRALIGLSQGGAFTSRVYAQHPTDFGYFGMFSGGPNIPLIIGPDSIVEEFHITEYKGLDVPKVFIGTGACDDEIIILQTVDDLKAELDAGGVPYTYVETITGHDWFCWSELAHDFVCDILWK